jgi:ABC-type glycerol-3-phosphate transport system substrate-binding protein
VPSTDWANPDWTWEAYQALAESLTKRSGDDVSVWGMLSFDLRRRGPQIFGGEWYDQETGLKCLCDEPEAVKGFQYEHDLVYKSQVCPTPSQSDVLEGGFLSGKVATSMMGPWSIPTYVTIEDFEWQLFPVPYPAGLDVKAPRWNPAWCNSTGISSKDKVDQSWKLIEFMTYDDDIYAKWCWDGLGRLPSRVSQQQRWLDSAKTMGPNVAWSVMVDAYDYAGSDFDAHQANAQQMLDLIGAEYNDPVMGEPDAVAQELATAIKPKIQALLQPV